MRLTKEKKTDENQIVTIFKKKGEKNPDSPNQELVLIQRQYDLLQ